LAIHVGKPPRKTNPVTDRRQQAAARLPPGRATHRAPQPDKSACPALFSQKILIFVVMFHKKKKSNPYKEANEASLDVKAREVGIWRYQDGRHSRP